VNGSGLMLLMGIHQIVLAAGALEHSQGGLPTVAWEGLLASP
jgi:hypothetical protein